MRINSIQTCRALFILMGIAGNYDIPGGFKVRALLVHANNTMLSMPDSKYVYSCLKEIEFMVYMDFFMTPTAELADIILPAERLPMVRCVPR